MPGSAALRAWIDRKGAPDRGGEAGVDRPASSSAFQSG